MARLILNSNFHSECLQSQAGIEPNQTMRVEKVESSSEQQPSVFDPVLTEVLPDGPREFPKDFVAESCEDFLR